MASCDLCGKQGPLFLTLVEETELQTCAACAKHGKIIKKPVIVLPRKKVFVAQEKKEVKEILQDIVDDYARIIKNKRESLHLTQDEFAKQLNEKVTILQKIEAGLIKPPLALAKKLENSLRIKIIEEKKEETVLPEDKKRSDILTIGDLIKIRKK